MLVTKTASEARLNHSVSWENRLDMKKEKARQGIFIERTALVNQVEK